MVLVLLIGGITGSYFPLALLAVFLNAPRLGFSLFSGVIADRLDRRLIMVAAHACYLGIAVFILLLLIANVIQPWHVFAVVGAERIANAVALEQVTSNIGKIIGPITGGILIASAGFKGAFVLLVVLDLAALLLIVQLAMPGGSPVSRPKLALWQSLRGYGDGSWA